MEPNKTDDGWTRFAIKRLGKEDRVEEFFSEDDRHASHRPAKAMKKVGVQQQCPTQQQMNILLSEKGVKYGGNTTEIYYLLHRARGRKKANEFFVRVVSVVKSSSKLIRFYHVMGYVW